MKACIKKIKSAMKPSSTSTTTELKGKHSTSTSNNTKTITSSATSTTSRQPSGPYGPGPSISPLKLRHAKCFQSSSVHTLHPNLTRKRRQIVPEVKVQPGSLTLAQIRSIPLSVCHIRGQHETRSSYVINAEQIRSKHPPLIKRSRSLSPQILRTTATIDLKSPTLVRSISNCGRPRENSYNTKGLVPIASGWRKSLIPIRSPPLSLRSKSASASAVTPPNFYPTKSSFIGTPKFTTSTTSSRPTPPEMKMKDGNWKLLDNEEDATVSMAMYQQQQRKKAAALSRQQNGGSVPAKTASKSRLFFQALVGGMDIQSRPRSPGTQFREYQERKAAAKGKIMIPLPRQQVHPLPQKPTSLPLYSNSNSNVGQYSANNNNNVNVPSSISMQPKFLFRRPLSSASSITSEPPAQGPRGFMTRQASGNSSSALFDDDPGIMSEAETSSTGFRRGGKIRSSLPVVRTPSKTLERPLGLVFLQYHNETKRAILPNEITSMDTVKALFVRSFPKQLTLEYLDVMKSKIYIHDNAKDMFYELEDLRDIRDRSVLRLFEPNVNGNGAVPSWDQDQSYFSEPEFDSDFQHQHIHKSKGTKGPFIPPYAYPIGATLPRGRPYSPQVAIPSKIVQTNNVGANPNLPPPKPQRNTVPTYGLVKRTPVVSPVPSNMIYSPPRPGSVQSERSTSFPPHGHPHYAEMRGRGGDLYANADGYISSPERSRYIPSEDPYYNYPPQTRSGSITPVIIDEEARFRMEHMERQLANLTGLVQKALTPLPGPPGSQGPRHHSSSTLPRNIGSTNYSLPQQRDYIPSRDFPDDIDKHSSSSSASLADERPPPIDKVLSHPKFGKEKSVSFSDDPPELSKQYSPTLHSVEKPTKSAIKSSTLPRMSQDRIVPVQPQQQHQQQQQPTNRVHQPQALTPVPAHSYASTNNYGTLSSRISPNRELSPEMYNQLRTLQKKAKELKTDVRALRRSVQAQAHTVRETLRDTYLRFKVVALAGNDQWIGSGGDPAKLRLKKDEELYKQEMIKLDKDLSELEATVEELRTQVINKRTRVNMSDVENMALILSKSSKSVADLKARFPGLHECMRNQLSYEMDRIVTEERFLKDEPDRLEIALRRCKKLTGTLVTLKRLASVQEQRLPDSIRSLPLSPAPLTPTEKMNRTSSSVSTTGYVVVPTTYGGSQSSDTGAETQLDALLDELNSQQQQHQQLPSTNSVPTLQRSNRLNPPDPPKRLPSYPSTESGGSPVRHHPPLPPKPSKIPPPPPPRSSSKHSPALMSPTSLSGPIPIMDSDTESLNSQDGIGNSNGGDTKLSQRHVELLRKQRLLQDQYIRLQQLQVQDKGLKKTGSDGNLGSGKLSLLRENNGGGSLTNLAMSNETDIL